LNRNQKNLIFITNALILILALIIIQLRRQSDNFHYNTRRIITSIPKLSTLDVLGKKISYKDFKLK